MEEGRFRRLRLRLRLISALIYEEGRIGDRRFEEA